MTSICRSPGWTYERAGAASMVYSVRRHRVARMLRLACGERA